MKRSWARCLPAYAGLLAIALLGHIWCLGDGTVLDDWWHQKGLREHGWSLSELLRSLVIRPSDFLYLWWQDRDVAWEYARPLFILAMKTVYHVIGGDDPLYLHAFSVGLHAISTLLVFHLSRRLTASTRWSFVAGAIFALYPHATVTVAWPSSQNAVMQTTFLLAALVCYLRGLSWRCVTREPVESPDIAPGVDSWRPQFAATLVFWLLALLTRENAILFPAFLACVDLAFGGIATPLRRWPFYAACGLIAAAFAAWRVSVIGDGLPDVYFVRPDGDGLAYAAWCAAKLVHYVCAAVWPAPMMIGPTGRLSPWSEAPLDYAGMLAIVIAIGLIYARQTWRMRGWWLWPLWIVLSLLPVTPVIATPHSGYMCGVGVAIGAALACSGLSAKLSPTLDRWARAARVLTTAYLAAAACLTVLNRWQWTGIAAAERYTPAWIAAAPPEPGVRDVYLINLPFVNVYLKPQLVQRLGPDFEQVRVAALTFAPQPVMVEEPTIVRQLDAHRFTVEVQPGGQLYFSRLLGRFLLEAFRSDSLWQPGDHIPAEGCDVRIVELDSQGVRKLEFTFAKPLNDPSHAFYVVSPVCGAARLRFEPSKSQVVAHSETPATRTSDKGSLAASATRLYAGEAAAAADWFALARSDNARDRWLAIRTLSPILEQVSAALAAPVQPCVQEFALGRPCVDDLEAWWREAVDDRVLREVWTPRRQFDALVKAREEVPHARMWAAMVVRSDLYLTGPPFPGPWERAGADQRGEGSARQHQRE